MWLEQCLQLPHRIAFREARIDGSKLIELNEEQLSDLGVKESSHLLRLLSHIAVFRSQLGRSLLVAEEPERPHELTLADGSCISNSALWSPVLQYREVVEHKHVTQARQRGSPQRGSPQDDRRPRLSSRARSAPGIQTSARLEGHRLEKNVKRGRQSGQKDGGQIPHVEYRRARSAELPRRQGTVLLSHQQALKVSRGQQSDSGASKKQTAPTVGCMQDPSSVIVSYRASSMDEAGSSLAATSTTLGSETCGVVHPFGSRSHTDVDAGGDGGSDELTLAERARSLEHASSSSFSAPRSSPRVRVNVSTNACQDSVLSNSSAAYSEFGRVHHRGPSFSTADRQLTNPLVKVTGPEIYDSGFSALKKSGVSRIGQAERRTLECMFVRGKASPGVGKYSPPCRTRIRGGSMGSAVRWRSGASAKSPGPESYTPQHFYLSNFK